MRFDPIMGLAWVVAAAILTCVTLSVLALVFFWWMRVALLVAVVLFIAGGLFGARVPTRAQEIYNG